MWERFMRIRGFAPSTPCWAELASADPVGAAGFYAELFGWQLEGDRFLLDGRAVAGLSTPAADRPHGWLTYLAATHLEGSAERVLSAYGRTLSRRPHERAGARSAVVADASGAVFGLWQSAGFAGTQLRGEPGTMAWSDLLTDDVAAATAFYGAVFGWELLPLGDGFMWALPAYGDFLEQRTPGMRANMEQMGAPERFEEVVASLSVIGAGEPGAAARWDVTFAVADADAAAARAAELGGSVVSAPADAPWVRSNSCTCASGIAQPKAPVASST